MVLKHAMAAAGSTGPAALIFVNGGEATIKDSVVRESFDVWDSGIQRDSEYLQ